MDHGGDDIIAGLAQIHVVVGMNAPPGRSGPAKYFVCSRGDNFIHVHVCGGAGPCLKEIHNKLVIKIAFHDFTGGADDGIRIF